jgi:hypothetical protein
MAPSPAPAALRIAHTGCAGLRLELSSGAVLAVDPAEDPGPVDAIIVTWNERERLQGALEAVRSGRVPRVQAHPAILAHLARGGALEASELGGTVGGVTVEAEPYQPVPYATPTEALRKLRSGLLGPLRAAQRLSTRARLPSAPPQVLRLTLADGRALVHLNCALHRGTPQDWTRDLAQRWGGAAWVLASWDYEEGPTFRDTIAAFGAQHLIVTDLVSEVRQRLGLPIDTRSLVCDDLAARGLPVQLLAAYTSLRFH